MQTLVVFDIGHTPLRNKVERTCRDFGMLREQFSAFLGDLTLDQRERLAARLKALLREHQDNEEPEQRKQELVIQVFPLCAADFEKAMKLSRDEECPERKTAVVVL